MTAKLHYGSARMAWRRKLLQRSAADERSQRLSRWAVIALILVALAAPLLLYSGPDVLYPAAPIIADEAIEGHLTLRAQAKQIAAAAHQAPVARQ